MDERLADLDMDALESVELDYKQLLFLIGNALATAEYYNSYSPSERWVEFMRDENIPALRKWHKEESKRREDERNAICAKALLKLTPEEIAALGIRV